MTTRLIASLAGIFIVASAPAQAQTEVRCDVNPSRCASPVLGRHPNRTVNEMRKIVKEAARAHIEQQTRIATGGRAVPTSRDRSGPLASRAHDRGAVDFAFPTEALAALEREAQRLVNSPQSDMREWDALAREAQRIINQLGPHYTAIVERRGRPNDSHTSYTHVPGLAELRSNGPYPAPGRATGDHIHVQPNYGIRHLGERPPSANRSTANPSTSTPRTPAKREPCYAWVGTPEGGAVWQQVACASR